MLRFLDIRLILACGVLFPMSAEYSVVNYGRLAGNLSDLTVASSRYDILLCSKPLVSYMRHVLELPVPCFGRRTVMLYRGMMPCALGTAAYYY